MNVTDAPPRPDPRIRTLKGLWIVAAVSTVAALIALAVARERTESAFKPRLAFPGLEETIPDITRVEIHSRDIRFTLQRSEDAESWGVEERGLYPVRTAALRSLLLSLGELELVEKKTARAERHNAVGLVAPEDGGEAVRVSALGLNETVQATILFGSPEGAETLDGRVRSWVRLGDDDQTWVGESRLELKPELEEWMALDILDVDASRIASVHTTPGDVSEGSEAFTIARSDSETYNFELLDLYDGEEMSGPTAANGLGRALIAMTFSDAKPAARIGFDNGSIAHYETFDGLGLTLRVKRHEEDFWITLAAETFEVDIKEGDIDMTEGEDAVTDVEAEAAAINAQAKGWAFRIPEWKGGQLTIARAAMIKQTSEESNDNE